MNATTKAVLVTGANGFLGKAVVACLEKEGWYVVRSARSKCDLGGVNLDFESPTFFSDLHNVPHVDAIVHLATKVGFGGESLKDLYLANISATAALVALAKHMDAHFVFASAALIAGSKASHIDRWTVDNPDSPYMLSKQLSERILQSSGIRAAILRIGGIFGVNGPSHLGLNRAIHAVLAGERPQMVGDGAPRRNYIYVKDAAAIIVDVLQRDIYGTHLVAGNEILSVEKMLKALCAEFLPGCDPLRLEGAAGFDQLIDPSPDIRQARSFKAALDDMRAEACR